MPTDRSGFYSWRVPGPLRARADRLHTQIAADPEYASHARGRGSAGCLIAALVAGLGFLEARYGMTAPLPPRAQGAAAGAYSATRYHVHTIDEGDGQRRVKIRLGRLYARGEVVADGLESGTGDVTSILIKSAIASEHLPATALRCSLPEAGEFTELREGTKLAPDADPVHGALLEAFFADAEPELPDASITVEGDNIRVDLDGASVTVSLDEAMRAATDQSARTALRVALRYDAAQGSD